jgi:acylphosphatase
VRLRRHYVITGRVQGVGFRFFTQAAAAREGVYGWVRNVLDGSVEIEAEGEAEAIDRFEHRIRQGPRGARVDIVDVRDSAPDHHNTGFEIR